MTAHTDNKFTKHHKHSVHTELARFIENTVLPISQMQAEEFWSVFSRALQVVADNTHSNLTEIPSACVKGDNKTPVHTSDLTMNAISPRWGSLYGALYRDEFIPHTAGLRIGNSVNVARRDRVVGCAKNFLDMAFPLTEGSHRDAAGYLVYFKNLLVILADGSTTGLKQPRQFIGKNGSASEPESILLEHCGMRVEVNFDRHGIIGEHDIANIDDIQLETKSNALTDFTATTETEKYDLYKHWFEQACKTRSNEESSTNHGAMQLPENSIWEVKLSGDTDTCQLVMDDNGNPVHSSIVDALVAVFIYANNTHGKTHLNIYIPAGNAEISPAHIEKLGEILLLTQKNAIGITKQPARIKVVPIKGDTVTRVADSSVPYCSVNLDNGVIDAMEQHFTAQNG